MKNPQIIIAAIVIAAFAFVAGCSPPAAENHPAPSASTIGSDPVSITVSAAASLTESFTEIGKLFNEQYPQVEVIFNFASSQELAQQINQGAQVEVFASANQKQMDLVVTQNQIPADAPLLFAQNRLVAIYPPDNPGNISTLADLARPGLKLVIAAAEVPVGQYSLEFLDQAQASGNFGADYKQAVLDNVVSYENNVKAVVTKITLGEADAGIVYATDASAAKDVLGILEIPTNLNVIADYPILALPGARQSAWGRTFVDFVLSDAGQQVLERYGFTPVR